MATLDFTPAQRALIDAPDSTYVEACPGAGKTQAIVQRFVERKGGDPRRGVALVSFTNAAVDEARSRCGSQPELLLAPNFVGTIDGFINRFIVGPLFAARTAIAPSFRDSWQNVPGSTFGAPKVAGQYSLDWFDFELCGGARFNLRRVRSDRRKAAEALEEWAVKRLEAAASSLWLRYTRNGLLDAASARLYLMQYLEESPTSEMMGEILAARFAEIIVDEVQDCCAADVRLLSFLRQAGIRLIMVGDPNQAIYGFRGASADGLGELRTLVADGERLNGNFRSSRVICGLVDSLRAGSATDDAVGTNADETHRIQLISYKSIIGVRAKVTTILANCDMNPDDVVVLAHSSSKARSCAGAPPPLKSSDSKLVRLATSAYLIQDEGSGPAVRLNAMRQFERILRELGPPETHELNEAEFLERQGLTLRSFRQGCLQLALKVESPFDLAPSAFKQALLDQSDSQARLGWSLKGVRIPKEDGWPDLPSTRVASFDHSTIHRYKGLQAPGIVLVVPDVPKGIDPREGAVSLWNRQVPGEPRNVLYVGASRAERLLIIAAHESVHGIVKGVLERDNVSFLEV